MSLRLTFQMTFRSDDKTNPAEAGFSLQEESLSERKARADKDFVGFGFDAVKLAEIGVTVSEIPRQRFGRFVRQPRGQTVSEFGFGQIFFDPRIG